MPPPRGLGTAHQQRRREIADAVLSVVARHGLPAVSLQAVADHADVSVGRIQHYFRTKAELIEAAFDRGNHLSSRRIAQLVGDDLETAPPRTVLSVVLTELVPHDEVTTTHLRVRQSFVARGLNDDAIARRLRHDYAVLHRRLADLVRRDQAAGAVRVDRDPHAVAVRLVAHAEGLASYVLMGITPSEVARAHVLASLDELYG